MADKKMVVGLAVGGLLGGLLAIPMLFSQVGSEAVASDPAPEFTSKVRTKRAQSPAVVSVRNGAGRANLALVRCDVGTNVGSTGVFTVSASSFNPASEVGVRAVGDHTELLLQVPSGTGSARFTLPGGYEASLAWNDAVVGTITGCTSGGIER
jgi:hypothetical protein